ncbi:hypothetical protein ACFO0N_10110 [Halobium salinum]|uniref:DUF222 domain-containing protein n=1 Tax=Halobium salinum TaxID=1364940 RepID=A0ABD5PBL6_9EURY|nr:hypothetical protein [Halobium salinum]
MSPRTTPQDDPPTRDADDRRADRPDREDATADGREDGEDCEDREKVDDDGTRARLGRALDGRLGSGRGEAEKHVGEDARDVVEGVRRLAGTVHLPSVVEAVDAGRLASAVNPPGVVGAFRSGDAWETVHAENLLGAVDLPGLLGATNLRELLRAKRDLDAEVDELREYLPGRLGGSDESSVSGGDGEVDEGEGKGDDGDGTVSDAIVSAVREVVADDEGTGSPDPTASRDDGPGSTARTPSDRPRGRATRPTRPARPARRGLGQSVPRAAGVGRLSTVPATTGRRGLPRGTRPSRRP